MINDKYLIIKVKKKCRGTELNRRHGDFQYLSFLNCNHSQSPDSQCISLIVRALRVFSTFRLSCNMMHYVHCRGHKIGIKGSYGTGCSGPSFLNMKCTMTKAKSKVGILPKSYGFQSWQWNVQRLTIIVNFPFMCSGKRGDGKVWAGTSHGVKAMSRAHGRFLVFGITSLSCHGRTDKRPLPKLSPRPQLWLTMANDITSNVRIATAVQ